MGIKEAVLHLKGERGFLGFNPGPEIGETRGDGQWKHIRCMKKASEGLWGHTKKVAHSQANRVT